MGKIVFYVICFVTGIPSLIFCYNWVTDRSNVIGQPEQVQGIEIVDEHPGYSLTYNLDGGAADNPTAYNLFTATFTLSNPVKEGHTFLGWTNSEITEPTLTVTICKGSAGDIEFTANYIPNLVAPQITITDTVVSWNAIDYANCYEVLINNEQSITVDSTQIDLSDYKAYLIDGGNVFKVRAINNSYSIEVKSEYSNTVTYNASQLTIPYVSVSDDDIASWYAIEHSDYYTVEICKFGTSDILANFTTTELSFDLSQYFNILTLNEQYWIKVTAHAEETCYLSSDTDWYVYTYEKEVDISNLSNISAYNKGYFVDELVDDKHTGTLFIQLEDVAGNVWGFGMTDTGIGDEYYSCEAEDITIYQLDKDNNTWSVYTTKYSEQVSFFENTTFLINDEHYFKLINFEDSRFDNALYCFTHYFAMMFDTLNSDRQHRTTSLGYSNSYDCTEEHTITLTDSLFSCIQTYAKTTNEVVTLVDTFKLNFTDLGKV